MAHTVPALNDPLVGSSVGDNVEPSSRVGSPSLSAIVSAMEGAGDTDGAGEMDGTVVSAVPSAIVDGALD